MLEKDIETCLRARKTQTVADFFSIASALMIVGLLYTVVTQINDASLAVTLLCCSFVFAGFAAGWNKSYFIFGRNWSPVTRTELLEVLERQINSDPEALTYLSKK